MGSPSISIRIYTAVVSAQLEALEKPIKLQLMVPGYTELFINIYIRKILKWHAIFCPLAS
jgi:hypothetical protein